MAHKKTSARIIVFGNAKGGSGKSTCALHTAVALMQAGHEVATIDLDGPQRTFTRAIDNRIAWNHKTGRDLVVPEHALIENATADSVLERKRQELSAFAEVISVVEHTHDFVIIDTPGYDTSLMRLVHGLADTLVTPINDSFVDVDLLVQPQEGEADPSRLGPYARLVAEAREQREGLDGVPIDWIVVQNRLSMIQSNNKIKVRGTLTELADRLGFRLAQGVSERVIFREFFPLGVTAFDPLDEATFGVKPNMSHIAARDEMRRLVEAIGLGEPAGFKTRARSVRARGADRVGSSALRDQPLAVGEPAAAE